MKMPREYKHYPFRRLGPGDEVVIAKDEQGFKDIKSFRALAFNTGKRLGRVFKCRMHDDGESVVLRREW